MRGGTAWGSLGLHVDSGASISILYISGIKNHTQFWVPYDLLISTVPLLLLTNKSWAGSGNSIKWSSSRVLYFGQGPYSSTLGHFHFGVWAAGVNTGYLLMTYEHDTESNKKARWMKALIARTNNQSSILRVHTVVGENWFPQVSSISHVHMIYLINQSINSLTNTIKKHWHILSRLLKLNLKPPVLEWRTHSIALPECLHLWSASGWPQWKSWKVIRRKIFFFWDNVSPMGQVWV